jgi:hypothetical protein
MDESINESNVQHSPVFISLGEWCETAYQINRYMKTSEAYFFNWLITHNDTYKSIFLDDAEFFKPKNWEISEDLIRVKDKATGILFQHEFNVIDTINNFIDESKVDAHLPTALSKFKFLKNKTLSTIAKSKNIFLVRQEDFHSAEDASKRIDHIKELFLPLNKNINIILTSRRINKEITTGKYLILRNQFGSSWEGCDESWDRVFDLALSAGP